MLVVSDVIRNVTIILLTGSLSISLFHSFCCTDSSITSQKLRNTSLTFLSSLCIAYIAELIKWITNIEPIIFIHFLGINVAVVSIYILSLMRLYHTFKETEHQLSKSKIYMHSLILTVTEIFWILQSVFWMTGFEPWNFACAVIAAIIFMVGYCHLTYLFNHNLFLLLLAQRGTVTQNTDENVKELNVRQKRLLQTIVKQTLLAVIVCIIVAIYSITLLATTLVILVNPDGDHSVANGAVTWIIAFMVNGTAICTFLTFSVNGTFYYCFCKKCHSKCDGLCQMTATKYMD